MRARHALVVRLKGGDPSVFGRLEEELAGAGRGRHRLRGGARRDGRASPRRPHTQRPLTRRGSGRSVSLTHRDDAAAANCSATRSADTEVFYMAGRQLGALSRRLRAAGWPADTPVCVVSRAGWPDQLASDHRVADLAAGRAAARRPADRGDGGRRRSADGAAPQPVPAARQGRPGEAPPSQP